MGTSNEVLSIMCGSGGMSAPREINKLLKFHPGSFYACPGPGRK